jgi:hypothetical protein
MSGPVLTLAGMAHHVAGRLPGGGTVLADYRLPVVTVMRRQLAAIAEGRPADPADAELIAGWAAAHPAQVCDPDRRACTHPGAGPAPFRPARYEPPPAGGSVCVSGCCLAHRRETYWNIQDRCWVHTDGWPCPALAGLPRLDACGAPAGLPA